MTNVQKNHYEESPISEAIYEIFVEPRPDAQWDNSLTMRLQQHFPGFIEEERTDLVDHFLNIAPGGNVQYGSLVRGERIRRWNSDRSRLIQFGASMCAFNVLRPYRSFVDYLPNIRELIGTYIEEWAPLRIARAGQRYINVVRLPLGAESGAEYFEIYPKLPQQLRGGHPPLAVQVETERFENGTTIINLGFRGVEDGHAVYLLDIYAQSTAPLPSEIDSFIAWQQQAHETVWRSFELSITDRSRELFKEVRK